MEKINLEDKLKDKVQLGVLPTPLYRLVNIEKSLNYESIYIKRDDMTGLGPGGNKTRSLEYLLAEAIKENADSIIVSGPLQSNLCTLTACACNKLGLSCVLVHNGEEPERYEGNVLLNHILGVEMHFIGNVGEAERSSYVDKLYRELKERGSTPYIIKNGASTGYGAFGYINAVYEIVEQCKSNNIKIDEIFAPGGNGGVATGLIYGNAMLGFPFKINIISVEYDKKKLLNNIEKIMEEINEITNIPFNYKIEDICNIIDDYRGEGWGQNTIESEKMVFDFAKTEGIFIENIYNSKVIVGMIDMIKKKKIEGNVCYIHTGGFGSLFSQF